MNDKEEIAINKMLKYIYSIEKSITGLNLEGFALNEEKVFAIVFSLCQIGELVKNISEETKINNPNIPWSVLKGLRNKIVHDYDGINLILIWDIITIDIPKLKDNLKLIN